MMRTSRHKWSSRVMVSVVVSVVAGALGSPRAHAGEIKIGYVNVEQVFHDYNRTKAVKADLEKRAKQKDGEYDARVAELKKLKGDMELLNDQAREAKQREYDQKTDDLQRFKANATRELSREQQKVTGTILSEIEQRINEYAKANGFALVLNSRALIYAQDVYDISDEVLKALNTPRTAKGEAR